MKNHDFIFTPSTWIGEGAINLNMVEEELNFYLKWNLLQKDINNQINAIQEIQINGISEHMQNKLTFFDFSGDKFKVKLENDNVGSVVGKGVIDEKMIAWEFRNQDPTNFFEGFETLYKQEDGSYLLHSEYVTSDQFRTVIEGRIWLSPKGESK